MQKLTGTRIFSIVIVLILLVGSLSIVSLFQSRQVSHREHFIIECDNNTAIRVSEEVPLGQFNLTVMNSQESFSYFFSYQKEFYSIYTHQNLSFRLESEYILGNGRYSVNESMIFGVTTSDTTAIWENRNIAPSGVLVLGRSLDNSSYIYNVIPGEKLIIHFSWRFNITSDIVPKEDFLGRLLVVYNIVETYDGLNSSMATSVISISWIIGIVVLLELKRRDKK